MARPAVPTRPASRLGPAVERDAERVLAPIQVDQRAEDVEARIERADGDRRQTVLVVRNVDSPSRIVTAMTVFPSNARSNGAATRVAIATSSSSTKYRQLHATSPRLGPCVHRREAEDVAEEVEAGCRCRSPSRLQRLPTAGNRRHGDDRQRRSRPGKPSHTPSNTQSTRSQNEHAASHEEHRQQDGHAGERVHQRGRVDDRGGGEARQQRAPRRPGHRHCPKACGVPDTSTSRGRYDEQRHDCRREPGGGKHFERRRRTGRHPGASPCS